MKDPHEKSKARGRCGIGFLVGCVCVALLAPSSSAGRRWIADANDTKGFLDVKATSHGHARGNRLKHTLTTYARWRSRDLWCGSIRFRFHELNRDLVVAYRKRLLAIMLNSRTREGIGAPEVSRPTKRRVAVVFPRRWLRKGIDSYEWSVTTVRRRETCPRRGGDPSSVFRDRAPGRGRIAHRL